MQDVGQGRWVVGTLVDLVQLVEDEDDLETNRAGKWPGDAQSVGWLEPFDESLGDQDQVTLRAAFVVGEVRDVLAGLVLTLELGES